MKIKKLTLNNFMAFGNAEMNWADNINIICGENSTGKTTLLKVMISVVEDSMNLSKTAEEIDTITNSYVNLLNDISYMHGNLRDGIWKFERDELKKLFTLEARLIELNKQSPVVRPLKGVLMTQLSNFILKSRNNYNEDYICKYISEDVARESIKNHEIWMRKTQDLNDEREQKVIAFNLRLEDGVCRIWSSLRSLE